MFIPGFKDLLKTLWLCLLITLWVVVGKPVFEFVEWMGAAPMVIPVTIGFGITFPILSTAFIHDWLWGKDDPENPSWFPRGASWWEAFWCYLAGWAFIVPLAILSLIVIGAVLAFSFFLIYAFGADHGVMGSNAGRILKGIAQSEHFPAFIGIVWFYGAAMTFKIQRWSNRAKEKPPAIAEGNTK
jgi:hypothetical protein